jgi:hypothetical protein
MPRLQKGLEALLATVGNVSKDQIPKASAVVFPPHHLHDLIHDVYRSLGGIQDSPKIRLGNWDIEFDGVAVELDEQLHFNKYRALTLQTDSYGQLSRFPLSAYRTFCDEHQRDCMRAGSHGKRWTSSGSEAQFGSAGPLGQLNGRGAPRWKQRAFYDFIKDTIPLVTNVRVARLSIWEPLGEVGATRTVGEIIDQPGVESAGVLAELVQRRAGR